MESLLETPSPGTSDSLAQSTTSGSNSEMVLSSSSTECALAKSSAIDLNSRTPPSPTKSSDIISTQDLVENECGKDIGIITPNTKQKRENKIGLDFNRNLKIIHLNQIPPECNYEAIFMTFKQYGKISEIRMDFKEEMWKWESWISYEKHEDAFNACSNISSIKVCNANLDGALCDKLPRKILDVYKPTEWCGKEEPSVTQRTNVPRIPKPPQWLVATAREENYNYFKFSKYLQKKVGDIKCGDISRFGKTSVLIKAKSRNQSIMLSLIKAEESEMLIDIKPHLNFSYARGVIFNRDLYEFSEQEILEMCPKQVWKAHKIPKTSMIIITFEDCNVPSHVFIENERISVRPYKQKPLQCYNCFKYGHPSRVCKNDKLCGNCSAPAHGECLLASKCLNCNESHKSTDRKCVFFQAEAAALLKADAEHISTSYARRLLSKTLNYAKALKSNASKSNNDHTGIPREENRGNVLKTGTVANTLSQIERELIPNLGTKPQPSSLPQMNSPRLSSQASSLPDLGEDLSSGELVDAPPTPRGHLHSSPVSPHSNNRRGSPTPLHHSPAKHLEIDTSNRFEVLSSSDQVDGSPDVFKEHKVSVELHHVPHRFNKVHNITTFKPRISRSSLTKKPSGSTFKTKPLPQRTSRKESFKN